MENGSSSSVAVGFVLVSGVLPDLSPSLLHEPDSGQPFLCGPQSSGECCSASDSVQCITDLPTCCSSTDGAHRGEWYFPNGTRLPFSGGGDIYENRGHQRVHLGHRNNPTSPVGIYRCDIPTIAVHDDNDISVRDTVYVGLYTASGGNANWKSHYKQVSHWLTIIYGPKIYYTIHVCIVHLSL